jgi:rubrerythrin
MADIKGTRTEQNLREAFTGESQAYNKYRYFASVAKKEGYKKLAKYFLETAENEKEHASLYFNYLGGMGSTIENLKAALAGELEEHTNLYPRMAHEAKEEGFNEIALVFEAIGNIEKTHYERFLTLLKEVETGKSCPEDETVKWMCRNCGHLQSQEELTACPVCKNPQASFQLVGDYS